MKTKSENLSELELQLVTDGLLSSLELEMTNSAFGYEYAIKALEEEGQFGLHAEKILSEIESFKEAYFEARVQMNTIDARRLEDFENSLKVEKTLVFAEPKYLH